MENDQYIFYLKKKERTKLPKVYSRAAASSSVSLKVYGDHVEPPHPEYQGLYCVPIVSKETKETKKT